MNGYFKIISPIVLFLLPGIGLGEKGHDSIARPLAVDSDAIVRRSAIGDFLKSNGNKWPGTLEELREKLDDFNGDTNATIVPFSQAPEDTNLNAENARYLYISPAGDLYIGAIPRHGKPRIEFLSRSNDTNEFDFGLINDQGKPQILSKVSCVSCHKEKLNLPNAGPIFYPPPWINSLARRNIDPTRDRSLHRAFIIQNYPDMAEFARKSSRNDFENKFHDLKIHGVNFFSDGEQIEDAVKLGHRVTYLHQLVRRAKASDKQLIIHFLLNQVICDHFEDQRFGESTLEFQKRFRERAMARSGKEFELVQSILDKTVGTDLGGISPLIQSPQFSHLIDDPSHTSGLFNLSEDDILKMHARKVEEHLPNAAKNESPTLTNRFGAPVTEDKFRTYGAEGFFTSGAFAGSYETSLKLPEIDRKAFCRSPHFKRLLNADSLPNRETMHQMIRAWQNEEPPIELKQLVLEAPAQVQKKGCMECHAGQVKRIQAPFDIASKAAWGHQLSSPDPKVREVARKWQKKVLVELDAGTMPPEPFTSTLNPTETEDLKIFLRNMETSPRSR